MEKGSGVLVNWCYFELFEVVDHGSGLSDQEH
jgi:hypothetical protein